MRIHFIAIGGAAMHNLAIALHKKGDIVSGSDDEIFEPSKSRLQKFGLLPNTIGWDKEKISTDIDAIVLGMHAKEDNPELLKAAELKIPIFSYPEYLYEQAKNKTRIVIGGSHGKTTITSMILHVLQAENINCDYMVGAQLQGFDTMVKLSHDAKYMVLEGDEYLASPIQRIPKFHLYKAHIAVLSGIAWDHMNVFPTFEIYVDQFRKFIQTIEKNGSLFYCSADDELVKLSKENFPSISLQAYTSPNYIIENGNTSILFQESKIPLQIFGKHNLMNLEAARLVCNKIGVNNKKFYQAISSFQGASKRMELISESDNTSIYKDFAHSPSKLKASIQAVKEQYPERKLYACIELHTYSSLNKDFLPQYQNTMDKADIAIVYFNPKSLEHKKLPSLQKQDILNAFNRDDLLIFDNIDKLKDYLLNQNWAKSNLLMMSSGNFDGMDLDLLKKIC
jgi:UDP-N-acetylmuramate: L-alanyl-gamma-D-glutamyl-meso-diaminopimelate ligase